jgi:hypothetical protein
VAGFNHPVRGGAVLRDVIGLEERSLVIIEAEPGHALQDAAHHLLAGALQVGVLNAQDEGASLLAREEPVEERGARPADVEVARGGRRKTNANV